MKHMVEIVAILSATPSTFRAMLLNLPDRLITHNECDESWCPFDIVGHLIHGDKTDWIPRLHRILELGETEPFMPFDRFTQFKDSEGKTLTELLDAFEKLRRDNLEELKSLHLTEKQLYLTGTHPELGIVTIRQLLHTWAVHDMSHLAQTARVISRQYSDDVGPWKDYIPIVNK